VNPIPVQNVNQSLTMSSNSSYNDDDDFDNYDEEQDDFEVSFEF